MDQFNKYRINKYLLSKQHLLPESKSESIIQVADDLCGLHATCPTTPYLSLFIRMKGFSKTDLTSEIEKTKSLIRTRSIRNTLHLLPLDKYFSVFAATRLQIERRSEQYLKHLGMTIDEFDFTADRIMIALSGRGLTTKEIKKEVGGLKFTNHVINILCDRLSIVRGKISGGWKSNIHRYYCFEDFYPKIESTGYQLEKVPEDLVISYIKTYGPVTDTDMIWWSGLKTNIVREALKRKADKLTQLEIADSTGHFFMITEDYDMLRQFRTSGNAIIHFLPAMDPYIMGYKDRHRFINVAFYDYVYDRFGNAAPAILLNGEIIGIWDIDDEKNLLIFFLFQQTGDEIYERVIEAGIEIGKFYCDTDVDMIEVRSVIPVKELTVGSFMSPLKNVLKDV